METLTVLSGARCWHFSFCVICVNVILPVVVGDTGVRHPRLNTVFSGTRQATWTKFVEDCPKLLDGFLGIAVHWNLNMRYIHPRIPDSYGGHIFTIKPQYAQVNRMTMLKEEYIGAEYMHRVQTSQSVWNCCCCVVLRIHWIVDVVLIY